MCVCVCERERKIAKQFEIYRQKVGEKVREGESVRERVRVTKRDAVVTSRKSPNRIVIK